MLRTDSRKIEKGDTFLALRGINDGHKYIEDAIEKGASEVIVEEGVYSVATHIVEDTRDYLIRYLDGLYKDKLESLKIIGMTGTNGKTTTCYLLHKALNRLGKKCGYIGTIGFYIDEKVRDLNNTTPDLMDIYEILEECVDKKLEYVVIEVSSHALSMKRIGKLLFDYAIFSNLTKDHLDYHNDMISYALAKQKLFNGLKDDGKAIINYDDINKDYFIIEKNHNTTYGFDGGDYHICDFNVDTMRSTFKINGDLEFETHLIGKHNIYNLTCIIIVLFDLGYTYEEVRDIIMEFDSPVGRMDSIIYGDNRIVVDYAHTPDAVLNVINSVRELKPNRIITIVGCGGNRDKTKRPDMAKIATNLSDYVIITSDNPRNEEPIDIINDMINGLENTNYEVIENRKDAIEKGVDLLTSNDVLMILGKGHETYQIIGDERFHFDDKEVINDYINLKASVK